MNRWKWYPRLIAIVHWLMTELIAAAKDDGKIDITEVVEILIRLSHKIHEDYFKGK